MSALQIVGTDPGGAAAIARVMMNRGCRSTCRHERFTLEAGHRAFPHYTVALTWAQQNARPGRRLAVRRHVSTIFARGVYFVQPAPDRVEPPC